jgi:hypothetical protein
MGSYDTQVTCIQRTQALTEIEADVLIVPAVLKPESDSKQDDNDDAPSANFELSSCLKTVAARFQAHLKPNPIAPIWAVFVCLRPVKQTG